MSQSIDTSLSGIRIARISTVPFFVVTQLGGQIERLAKSGASVTVVTSDGPELALLDGIQNIRRELIDIPRSIAPLRDTLALFRLFIFFRREHIQIAHSTTPKAGLLTAIAARLAGVPVRLHTFTGQPWVNMRGFKRWLTRSSDILIGWLNTRCYADSASQRQFLIDQKIVKAESLFVIGSGSLAGVDIHRFDQSRFSLTDRAQLRKSFGIPEDAPVLLFVGRITADKGVRELLEAFKSLNLDGSNAHLVFVGQFDLDSGVAGTISREEIMRLNNTHIAGYSECPEMYLAIADVLCLPSYREGFGTVVIEAAAMGIPTVGTKIYGLTDAVEHGKTGLLVSPQNSQVLASALNTLLMDEAMRIQMGNSAMLRARSLFDADLINKQVAAEYANLFFVLRKLK